MNSQELIDQVHRLKAIVLGAVTDGDCRDSRLQAEFRRIRTDLMSLPSVRKLVPRFVCFSSDLSEIRCLMQERSQHWGPRREAIRQEFEPLLAAVESSAHGPADDIVSETLSRVDSDHVREAWRKALERRTTDAGGAITAARSLLESVCKHIIDESAGSYTGKEELPKLYRMAVETLDLAPSRQTEPLLKQILGGAEAVVGGLGALRSKLGDAHGKGKNAAKATARHAELAVNLAGAVATFLIATLEEQNNNRR